MKAVVAAFNQEKALVGAFSVITNLRMELFEALARTPRRAQLQRRLLHHQQRGRGRQVDTRHTCHSLHVGHVTRGRYAVTKFGLDRVLVLDWDVHHGEETRVS